MYEERANWKTHESKHFVYKFLAGSEAEKDLELIVKNRESAYTKISDFLGIKAEKKACLFFIPALKTAKELKMMINVAVPHLNFASVIYNDFPLCPEKIAYGHEICHILAYYWDKEIYHLELLEEGLAVYLDQSGSNKHVDFLNSIHARMRYARVNLTLDVSAKFRATNYAKSASIVKFLVEAYGIDKFRELYISSVIDRVRDEFVFEEKPLSADYFKMLLKKVYDKGPFEIQKEWLSDLGLQL